MGAERYWLLADRILMRLTALDVALATGKLRLGALLIRQMVRLHEAARGPRSPPALPEHAEDDRP